MAVTRISGKSLFRKITLDSVLFSTRRVEWIVSMSFFKKGYFSCQGSRVIAVAPLL